MQQLSSRIEYIDLAKGICILMVIFNHADDACGDPSYLLKDTLTILRMPLYFLLSGLFFKRYGGVADFFIKKVNKLIIPFVFFHVLSCFVYPWLNKTSFEWHTLWDFFWHEGWIPNGPLWFLLCLFWQNIIFYGLYIISDRIGSYRIVFLPISSMMIGIFGYYVGNGLGWHFPMNLSSAMTGMPFFCAGYILRNYTDFLTSKTIKKYLLPLCIICFVYTYCFAAPVHYFMNKYSANLWQLYTAGFSGVMGVLFLSRFFGYIPFISYIGRYSIILLVTHLPLIQRLMPRLFRLEIPVWWLSALIGTVIVSLLYYAIIPICKRFLPYVTAQKELLRSKKY